MLRIGLTGGIGSGKSTVADRFRRHGVPVVDADQVAREIVEPSRPAYREIVEAFGREILDAEGKIDRNRLRAKVFADPAQRRRLEALLHPRIRETIRRRVEALDAPYCILMIPLLVESGQHYPLDRILVVDADEARRIEWVKRRDGASEAQIRAVMAAQADSRQRLAVADDVIHNDGDRAALDRQVDRLHESYLAMAQARRDGA